jgi:ankyrin repeat protein
MAMPSDRIAASIGRLRWLAPAWLAVAAAIPIQHPLALVPLLLAQPLFLLGAAIVAGFVPAGEFRALLARRGATQLLLFVAYAALVALLIGTPLAALARTRAGLDALLLSLGVLAAIVSLWRVWPAFGLALLWHGAYPDADSGSRSVRALSRCLAYALQLTRAPELFLGVGLAAAIALLLIGAGAVLLAGFGMAFPAELRLLALAGYGLLLCPLAHLLLIQRAAALLEPALDDFAAPDQQMPARTAESTPAPVVLDARTRDAALLKAALAGRTEDALALLARRDGAEVLPHPDDRDQRSLTLIAAGASDTRLLRALIERGADINRSIAGLTPLLAATRDSYHGRPETVMMLVSNGAERDAVDADGNTPLHHAALSRDATVAAILLDAGAALDRVNRSGLTPLGVAAMAGNEALLRCLLERGARPEDARALPVLIAACEGPEDAPALVQLLLRRRADVHATDALARTALHAAALNGHAEMAGALLEAGAQIDARDRNGVTALMDAARAGADRVLQRLLFAHPDPNLVDALGRNALMIACQSRNAGEATVRLLRDLGADPSLRAKDGRNAIDHAVAQGRWPLVALLDPDYVLPSAVREMVDDAGASLATADRVALLARALEHGRMAVAQELIALAPALSQDELLRCWLQLVGQQRRAAFDSLLDAGLVLEHEQPLLHRCAALLPPPQAALAALLDRGANCGGGRLLLDLMRGPRAGAEALALIVLERGADFSRVDDDGTPPLLRALELGWVDCATALILRGADPNGSGSGGRTALHLTTALPEPQAVPLARSLLLAGADPERPAADGRTAGGSALAAGRAELARLLCWHGSFRHPGRALQPADLPAAARCGDLEAVRRLLDLGFAIDARDAQGSTALLRACGGGQRALAAELLARGADPTLVAESGMSCLTAAAGAGRESLVALLLAHGVAIDAPIAGGATALMVAAARGQLAVLRTLLAHSADAERADAQGNTALHAAAQFAFETATPEVAREQLRALLDAGAALDARNSAGQTPLLIVLGALARPTSGAPRRGLAPLVQLLLSRGAEVEVQDQRGVSVLHAAAMHGALDVLDTLRRAGADSRLKDRLGRSAHEVAVMLGYVDVAGELKRLARDPPGARASDLDRNA